MFSMSTARRREKRCVEGWEDETPRGYVMLRLPDHPRARSAGYVFEHILVMEEVLGRPLHPHETVHHRNGIRDDNSPTNLELWVRPQPSGIRAEDAVSWALERLDRYAEEDATLDTSNNDQP
jgi:hypothetical protein